MSVPPESDIFSQPAHQSRAVPSPVLFWTSVGHGGPHWSWYSLHHLDDRETSRRMKLIAPSSPIEPAGPPPVPVDADLLCGGCAQNLRGVASDRCPECGRRFDRARLLHPAVPW